MASAFSREKQEEYATKLTLTGFFLSLFIAFISKHSLWDRDGKEVLVRPFDFILLALSTLRLGRMVAYDKVMEPVRHPFTQTVEDETGAGDTVAPRQDSGVRRSLGQLISCPICAGTWIAAGLVYLLHSLPNPTRIFITMLGATGLAELLNSLNESLSWSGELARTITGNETGNNHQ